MDKSELSEIKRLNRELFYEIWQAYKADVPQEGEEARIAELMSLHKDWYHYWDSDDFDYEFDPEVDEFDPFAHITFDTIIMNQIESGDPKQAKFTYNKLTARGNSHLEAIHKMAFVFVEEYFEVMKKRKEFNQKRYIRKLKNLK